MKIRAQSTVEYMVMIAVIVGALAAMGVYTKRAVQGRIRSGADQVSEGVYMPRATQGFVELNQLIVENSNTYVDKTSGTRESITDTNVNIEQRTNRSEHVDISPGGR